MTFLPRGSYSEFAEKKFKKPKPPKPPTEKQLAAQTKADDREAEAYNKRLRGRFKRMNHPFSFQGDSKLRRDTENFDKDIKEKKAAMGLAHALGLLGRKKYKEKKDKEKQAMSDSTRDWVATGAAGTAAGVPWGVGFKGDKKYLGIKSKYLKGMAVSGAAALVGKGVYDALRKKKGEKLSKTKGNRKGRNVRFGK